MGLWDWIRSNEGLWPNVGLLDMKEFEKSWSGASTNSLKHHNINPTAAHSRLFCPQKVWLPWAKWLVQTELSPLIKVQPNPTGQKYSVTCWPIHWLANTLPFQHISGFWLMKGKGNTQWKACSDLTTLENCRWPAHSKCWTTGSRE